MTIFIGQDSAQSIPLSVAIHTLTNPAVRAKAVTASGNSTIQNLALFLIGVFAELNFSILGFSTAKIAVLNKHQRPHQHSPTTKIARSPVQLTNDRIRVYPNALRCSGVSPRNYRFNQLFKSVALDKSNKATLRDSN